MSLIPNLINFIRSTLETIITFIRPPKELSWRVPIWLSVFSWLMSALAVSDLLQNGLASMGWIFLTLGVGWYFTDHPVKKVLGFSLGFSIGPWITGALACVFLFNLGTGEENGNLAAACVFWPLISTAIAAIPTFLTPAFNIKIPSSAARQKLVLTVLLNLVLSCWFQFHFLVQGWLQNYPSLLTVDPTIETRAFSDSAFVVAMGEDITATARGEDVLTQAEILLKADLDNRPWPSAERWLLNLREKIPELQDRVMEKLPQVDENPLWTLYAPRPTSEKSGYDLKLLAIWRGPTAQGDGYYFAKTCRIRPRAVVRPSAAQTSNANEPPAQNARVTCDPKSAFISGLPIIDQ